MSHTNGFTLPPIDEEDKKQILDKSLKINLKDAQLILNIINVCTKRGAIEAAEFSTVGQLYDRLLNNYKTAMQDKTN
jgi:hypothetical protein